MLRKRVYVLLLALLLLSLTGCGGSIVADLYVQDVYEVLEDPETELYTSAVIALETWGESYYDDMKTMVEQNFKNARNFRTSERDFSDYLVAEVKIPIYELDHVHKFFDDQVVGIVVLGDDDGAGFGVIINKEKFEELSDHLYEEHWQRLSVDDFTITVKLINDLPGEMEFSAQGVYVNRKPVYYEEIFELERRDYAELKLSDVLRDSIYEEGLAIFAVF